MRRRIALASLLFLVSVIAVSVKPAYACDPASWTIKEAYESKAMVYGKVADTENGGRKATVDVISYIGPKQAPRTIYMPATIDDRDNYPAGYSCPDFSMTFKEGEEYVFFLADIPPNLRLLSPSWRTASLVEEGQVTVELSRGKQDDLQRQLKSFAESKGLSIQAPTRYSPVWGGDRGWLWLALLLIGFGVAAGSYYVSRMRAKTGPNEK